MLSLSTRAVRPHQNPVRPVARGARGEAEGSDGVVSEHLRRGHEEGRVGEALAERHHPRSHEARGDRLHVDSRAAVLELQRRRQALHVGL